MNSNYSDTVQSYKTANQSPLDAKLMVNSVVELSDYGTNNKAFTYYRGMLVFSHDTKQYYQWTDDFMGKEMLFPTFTYPLGTTFDGIDYSGLTFCFVKYIQATSQIQSDWDQIDNTKPDYIKNKPASVSQVQSNWNETNTALPSYIQNKPDLSQYVTHNEFNQFVNEVNNKFEQIDNSITNIEESITHIYNGDTQIQSDWNQNDNTKKDYIKNKPSLVQQQIWFDLDILTNTPSNLNIIDFNISRTGYLVCMFFKFQFINQPVGNSSIIAGTFNVPEIIPDHLFGGSAMLVSNGTIIPASMYITATGTLGFSTQSQTTGDVYINVSFLKQPD